MKIHGKMMQPYTENFNGICPFNEKKIECDSIGISKCRRCKSSQDFQNKDDYYESKLKSLKNDGNRLQFIKSSSQTLELCKIAIADTPYAFQYVLDQTEEICWFALKRDIVVFQWILRPTLEMCIFAVTIDKSNIEFVPPKYTAQMWKEIRKQIKKSSTTYNIRPSFNKWCSS